LLGDAARLTLGRAGAAASRADEEPEASADAGKWRETIVILP